MTIVKKFSYNEYQCESCKINIESPEHCGRAMNVEENNWICWKGDHTPCDSCNPSILGIENCCDKMKLIPVNKNVVRLL